MHYHLEIVLPPTDDLLAAITEILAPFHENGNPENDDWGSRNAFWDYWKIGGRWSGQKILDRIGKENVEHFIAVLNENKITVSSFQAGKQTLNPSDQDAVVDRLWNDCFPDSPVKTCPLFDNYKGDTGDVMLLRDVPAIPCGHVIIAGLDYKGKKLEAKFMRTDTAWNGCNYQKTTWDETLAGALADYAEHLGRGSLEYVAKNTPQPDWLVVTVDYHS